MDVHTRRPPSLLQDDVHWLALSSYNEYWHRHARFVSEVTQTVCHCICIDRSAMFLLKVSKNLVAFGRLVKARNLFNLRLSRHYSGGKPVLLIYAASALSMVDTCNTNQAGRRCLIKPRPKAIIPLSIRDWNCLNSLKTR
jgi:hypothetical protein